MTLVNDETKAGEIVGAFEDAESVTIDVLKSTAEDFFAVCTKYLLFSRMRMEETRLFTTAEEYEEFRKPYAESIEQFGEAVRKFQAEFEKHKACCFPDREDDGQAV